MDFLATALDIARAQVGVHEVGGNNRGPQVDEYNRSVGLDPEKGAYAWCTSALFWIFMNAALKCGVKNPLPRTAKADRLWELAFTAYGESNPAPGFLYILAHGNAWKLGHYTDNGHAGMIEAVDGYDVVTELSGNTNAKGSREGNCFERHEGQPEVTHGGTLLGYLNFGKILADAS